MHDDEILCGGQGLGKSEHGNICWKMSDKQSCS